MTREGVRPQPFICQGFRAFYPSVPEVGLEPTRFKGG